MLLRNKKPKPGVNIVELKVSADRVLEKAGTSPVLFHATGVAQAAKILQDNRFAMTFARGDTVEDELTGANKYNYYMSCARTMNSRYIESTGNIVLKLDGKKLGQRYKSVPIDYWGEHYRKSSSGSYEQEDRILSLKGQIPNASSYIQEIYIVLPRAGLSADYATSRLKEIIAVANTKNIPVFAYAYKKDLLLSNKRKALSSEELTIYLNGHKYKEAHQGDHNKADAYNITAPIDLYNVLKLSVDKDHDFDDVLADYTKDEEKRKLIKNLTQYTKHDFVTSFTNAVRNTKKAQDQSIMDALEFFTKGMRSIKATNISDVYDKVYDLKQLLTTSTDRRNEKRELDKTTRKLRDFGITFKMVSKVEQGDQYIYITNIKLETATPEYITWGVATLCNSFLVYNYNVREIHLDFVEPLNYEATNSLGNLNLIKENATHFVAKPTIYTRHRLPLPATLESADTHDAEHQQHLDATGFWGKQGAGCIFLAKDTGRFCVAHRSAYVEQPNTWGVWGGALDPKETPKSGVLREVREETGYQGKVELLPLFVFKHTSGFHYSNFLAIVDKEFTPKLDWENKGFEWCEYGDWPSPMHFGLKGLLEDTASKNLINKKLKEIKKSLVESRIQIVRRTL